jgi:hypothetical protein
VARCAVAGHESIDDRLGELDEEWDVDRTLEAVAGSAFLLTLMLGRSAGWFWHLITALIATLLLLHAIQRSGILAFALRPRLTMNATH